MDMNLLFITYIISYVIHHHPGVRKPIIFALIFIICLRNTQSSGWLWFIDMIKKSSGVQSNSINLVEFRKNRLKGSPHTQFIRRHRRTPKSLPWWLRPFHQSLTDHNFTILIWCFFPFLSLQIASDFIAREKRNISIQKSISITMAFDGQWRPPIWY